MYSTSIDDRDIPARPRHLYQLPCSPSARSFSSWLLATRTCQRVGDFAFNVLTATQARNQRYVVRRNSESIFAENQRAVRPELRLIRELVFSMSLGECLSSLRKRAPRVMLSVHSRAQSGTGGVSSGSRRQTDLRAVHLRGASRGRRWRRKTFGYRCCPGSHTIVTGITKARRKKFSYAALARTQWFLTIAPRYNTGAPQAPKICRITMLPWLARNGSSPLRHGKTKARRRRRKFFV